MSERTWHQLGRKAVLERLGSDAEQGLSETEAARRLTEVGPNRLVEARRRAWPLVFLAQLRDVMILVLLAAALVSGFLGEPQDTIAILVIVLLNAVIGGVQEIRAERAIAALRQLAAPSALLLRGGRPCTRPSSEVVPGDVVLLEAGNMVPADLRLLEVAGLQTDESALTGESHASEKAVARIRSADAALGERHDMAFRGTLVVAGRARGVAVATGMQTALGGIASLLQSEESVRTPLQRRLARFSRVLALAVLAICAVVFATGLLQGQPTLLMFLTAMSLAVAAIPEALPAVVTVSLALGARRLGRERALTRRLPAVETLGSVTTICSDKTGTLTQNRMTAERFVVAGAEAGELGSTPPWRELGRALALSNDVSERDGEAQGDPTEIALYRAAADAGFERAHLEQELPRRAELPFDSGRKRMSTFHAANGERVVAYTKGAPETVLERCEQILGEDGVATLQREDWVAAAQALAREGYRVLAVARRELPGLPMLDDPEAVERELTLLGLVALIDPPRPEVPQAVADCLAAGITPVMITGDHPGTATAIAQRLGIAGEGSAALTGRSLDRLSDAELVDRVKSTRVYARVDPAQKIRIVKALQERGEFVAMTGDGVNDAPALRRAGIGVAMGRKGTDVAREAADMVLLDDNFATIVTAVRTGRRIFDNIRKFIKDTMSSNSGEIWTLFLAPFLGLPVPLLPIHILWINLVTDGLPGLAFSAEPAEPGSMRRPPRPPHESIFAHGMWQHILWVGLFVGGVSIASQAWAISRGLAYWQTVVFTVLTLSQLFHSLSVRSERASLREIGLTSNLPMLAAVLVTSALQLAVIYLPALQPIFRTQALPAADLALCFGLASLVLVAVEIEKALVRRGVLYAEPKASSR